ncbi:MAG: Methyltransferase [Labilithrix sp.]|nr:Methyltransferase [Labilithrix sp.]
MPLPSIVRPLEDGWRDVIDAVLARRGAPRTGAHAALAPKLRELSQAYNQGLAGDQARVKVPLDARIAFSFARDVPKGAGAVRELVATGALAVPPEGRALRIVDLGAGLGAMTWGIARALAARADRPFAVEALLVDEDAAALAAAVALGAEAETRLGGAVTMTLRTRTERLAKGMTLPEADVVVLGQVFSEMDVGLDPEARAARHADLLADLLSRVVAPDGALVIVEPALRARTRHLHAVRDRLAARGVTVFAPCLHAAGCPMLATEGDWCHEDLAVDLPSWLVPLARAAGLRWQGLTFAHLVLRRDGRTLLGSAPAAGPRRGQRHLRVVSELMVSKGKAEIFGCTTAGERVRLRRLDRDAKLTGPGAPATQAWSALGRGDLVTLSVAAADPAEAAIDDRGRVSGAAEIDVWPAGK